MVIVKLFFLFFFSIYLLTYKLNASEILDHETEVFFNTIINDIKNVNNINRNIKFKIISSNDINAFVDQNNIVYLTSGLIENCDDYVAITSVLAHEIGYIEKNHIVKSVRGINGGYILVKSPKELKISDILLALDQKVKQ